MELETIQKNPFKANIHLERYVNFNSVSSKSMLGDLEPRFSAFHGEELIELYSFLLPNENLEIIKSENIIIKEYQNIIDQDYVNFIVHPQILEKKMIDLTEFLKSNSIMTKKIGGFPTASNRTFLVKDIKPFYLKTDFPGRISSNYRQISGEDIQRGIWITDELYNLHKDKKLPEDSGFYAEKLGLLISHNGNQLGMVLRDYTSFPNNLEIKIPLTSIFTKDSKNPKDPLLLDQLAKQNNVSVEEYFLNNIVKPHITHWAWYAFEAGIINSPHGQNTNVEFTSNFRESSLCYRDFHGKRTIPEFRNKLGLYQAPNLLYREKNQDYKERLSLSYDFVMGFLFYDRIIPLLVEKNILKKTIAKEIKSIGKKILGDNAKYLYKYRIYYEGVGKNKKTIKTDLPPKYR